jgi:hypothetical protein
MKNSSHKLCFCMIFAQHCLTGLDNSGGLAFILLGIGKDTDLTFFRAIRLTATGVWRGHRDLAWTSGSAKDRDSGIVGSLSPSLSSYPQGHSYVAKSNHDPEMAYICIYEKPVFCAGLGGNTTLGVVRLNFAFIDHWKPPETRFSPAWRLQGMCR